MKIGFHYHVPITLKDNGKYYTSGAIGVFIDSLAELCEEVTCFLYSALSSEVKQMDYELQNSNISIVDLGPHNRLFSRLARSRQSKKIIDPHLRQLDIMLVRGPSPLLPAISEQCRLKSLPYTYLLVGDYVKSFTGSNLRGIKRFILKKFYTNNKRSQDAFAANALIFANSHILYDEYKKISKNTHLVRTTTLKSSDFYKREEASLHDPIELLFTGRIEPAKGLDEVLDAMALLQQRGIETKLNLVGWEDRKGYLSHLMQKSEDLDLKNELIFHGKKQVGEELFSMYRAADVYVIASKGNEGFPRTIWEALANSLPVIASNIGSIPHFLDDGKSVLLVKPGSAEDIAAKLNKLISDKELRNKLVDMGYKIAKDNTLYKQASNMLLICEKHTKN